MMTRSDTTADLIGFVLGFLFGCCGLLFAVLLKPDYLRGAIAGVLGRFVLGMILGVASESSRQISQIELGGTSTFPWELLLAFGICTALVLGLIAGAIWAFGSRDDDDDDEGPPGPPPADPEYVTFSR